MNEEELKLAIKSAFDDAGFRAANSEIKRAEKSASSMGASFANAAKIGAVAVAGLGTALAGLSVKAILMASDLGESQSKVNVVFKESAGVINDWAKTTVQSIGMSESQALAAAGTYGNLFTALGLGEAQAADFSKGLVNLSADLASFNNSDPTQVLDALRAGLSGEAEPMKRYGVALNEVAMKQAAMKAGLGDNVQALSEAQKMQLRYNIIMEQTKTAQGDYARTSTGLANTMRTIKAEVATVVTELGQRLLPTVQAAASGFLTGFQDAKKNGLDVFDAALAGVADALTALGLEDAEAKVKAFGDMVKNAGAFVRDDLWPALKNLGATVVAVGKFLADHRAVIAGVVAAYVTLKTAMAIQAAFAGVSGAATLGAKALVVWGNVAKLAGIQTLSLSTALKIAMGPVGWLIAAVGLLSAAWAGNWGGIRQKTAAVVEYIKGVPAMVEAAWGQVKTGLALLVSDFKAKFAAIPDGVRTALKVLLMILFPLPMLFTKTGRDMVAGLWNGLKAGWDAMVGWVTGKAKALIASVKGVFKMSSPSRVMMEIGHGIMEGWALGMVAGGVWVVRSARRVMEDTLAEFHAADAAAVTGGVVAAMAKAAVDAALAADGVIQGKRESAADAWGRYYDEMMRRADEFHEAEMKRIEDERKAERKKNEDKRDAFIELAEKEKRHFEWLKSQQEQEAARGGKPVSPKLEDFGLEVERVDAAFKDIFKLLGDEDLAAFWKRWNDDVNANITTTEDLGKAIDAILGEIGKKYEDIFEDIETKYDGQAKSEEDRHKRALAQINERKALIDALIQAQADADADLADLIAARDRLLAQAREAIAAAQKAAEVAEDRIHAGVMKNIEAERKAEERAHRTRLIHFEDERKAIDAAHERRMGQLQQQRERITDGFNERQRQIERDRTALSQLKLDLGVEDALVKLTGLEQKLNDLQGVIDSFQVQARGRDALDEQRKRIVDRVKITTDAQRKALQDVLDSGTLNDKDQRRVQLLLLGRGTQRAEDVRRILGAGADVLKGEIAAAQMIVDYNTQQIAIRERLIETAETQLKIDQENAQVQIDAIDKRIAAEDERYRRESANLAARMTSEAQAYEDTLSYLDAISQAEDDRHAKRMADIAAEYALELARLGMTQQEIDAMVAAARAESERIAHETEETWRQIRAAAGGGVGSIGGGVDVPVGPIPIIGMPIRPGDFRPQGGAGAAVTIEGAVTAAEGTIQNVELGGVTMNPAFTVRIGARDIAAEIIEAVVGDTVLVDKLGKRLNERKGVSGQTGGTP